MWAAALFNTVMAVIGFLRNGKTTLNDHAFMPGVVLATVSVVALIVFACRARHGATSRPPIPYQNNSSTLSLSSMSFVSAAGFCGQPGIARMSPM
mgnify:CR=1 FL=1